MTQDVEKGADQEEHKENERILDIEHMPVADDPRTWSNFRKVSAVKVQFQCGHLIYKYVPSLIDIPRVEFDSDVGRVCRYACRIRAEHSES